MGITRRKRAIKTRTYGQVIKGVGGVYTVRTAEGRALKCYPRGKLRQSGAIFVGDIADVLADDEGIIEGIRPRKSALVRPPVANIDGIVVLLAPVPKPDFLLADKLIIGALEQDIRAIICINKADLPESSRVAEEVARDFEGLAEVLVVSTKDGRGVDALRQTIRGGFYALAGQSAVGKSSLLNCLVESERMTVGAVSEKSGRGKNTTRHVEILETADGTRIADTCGFSRLELPEFDPADLAGYYTDFDRFALQCAYRRCRHDAEPDCAVRAAAAAGMLSPQRYERYLRVYRDALRSWEKRYR